MAKTKASFSHMQSVVFLIRRLKCNADSLGSILYTADGQSGERERDNNTISVMVSVKESNRTPKVHSSVPL